ncbi:MAG TPA: tetraacyldisaccharide 4'-kinase [Pyrinomonadaceae bacterium]|jgi:tetraacyldisaccharide 4'-kinase|nr:tetraacyldisaccharide 4'-kinase [Pyrinomonadaceae bacterium]
MNPLASLILPPLSLVYGALTRARLTAYRRGWFATSQLAAPVISVGNLTTGGTGKTPLVEWTCKTVARETGKKVCVLTRGYGRPNPQSQVVVSDGVKILASVHESGDEPYLLAQNLIGVAAVISNPDRLAAGNWAMKNLGTEVFVLDDGFQHLQLARDLDIVTIDATNPWGGGSSLPAGRLREPRTGLARAGCVVITRTDQVENTATTNDTIRQFTSAIPILSSRMLTSAVRTLDGQVVDKTSLRAQPVAAFCGVGNPESFFNSVRLEGFETALTKAFPDHHNYTQGDVAGLVDDAKVDGATALLTTAKDAIKLSTLDLALPCYVLDIQISIDDDERLVKLIRNACGKENTIRPKG